VREAGLVNFGRAASRAENGHTVPLYGVSAIKSLSENEKRVAQKNPAKKNFLFGEIPRAGVNPNGRTGQHESNAPTAGDRAAPSDTTYGSKTRRRRHNI